MNKIVRIVSWVFSIGFGIAGLVLLAKSPLSGLFAILLGILLFPKTKEFVQKKFGYIISGKIKVGLAIVLLIAIGIAAPKGDSPVPSNDGQKANQNTATPLVKSDQELLEDSLKQIASNHKASVNYKGIDVDSGAKMITVSFNVLSFLDRDSLLHDTGRISTETFKAVFESKLNATDTVIWYYGETTDRYGNKSDAIVLSYAMDKETYNKINWSNFNAKDLCNFLKQELGANPSSGNACVEKVKIQ
jgi:hypothetical protein